MSPRFRVPLARMVNIRPGGQAVSERVRHRPGVEVSLEQRQEDYDRAEREAMESAVEYLNAKAGGCMTPYVEQRMDESQRDLLRARRRLQQTYKRFGRQ